MNDDKFMAFVGLYTKVVSRLFLAVAFLLFLIAGYHLTFVLTGIPAYMNSDPDQHSLSIFAAGLFFFLGAVCFWLGWWGKHLTLPKGLKHQQR